MMEVRVAKRIAPRPNSAGFSLEVEFSARPGITALFGPTTAGKTLTLDVIAGFARPDAGRILLEDRILFDAASRVNLPPRLRNCGYVLRDDALFPHMTVRQNLIFAAQQQPRLERHRRVNELLDRFHLTDVAARRPQEMPRGQKQCCAIARALGSSPRVLLLDEPARGLDAVWRSELYRLLREIRADCQIPILLVTQDLEECCQLADEMLILQKGRLVQSGPPRQILEQPAGVDIARLLGISNLFQAEIMALDPGRNTSRVRFGDQELTGPYFPGHLLGDRVWLCARAEDLRVMQHNGTRPEPNQLSANLLRVSEKSRAVRLEFSGDISVELPYQEFEQLKDNKDWLVEFPPAALRVLREVPR
jgi:molybdate transport system ATP-binding protein